MGHTFLSFIAIWTLWEGIKGANPAIASLLTRIDIVVILLMSFIFLKEVFRRQDILGAIAIVFGTVVIASDEGSMDFAQLLKGGSSSLWLIMSGICFGLSEYCAKLVASSLKASVLVIMRGFVHFIGFGIIALVLHQFEIPSFNDSKVILISALTGPVLARVFFMHALQRLDLGKAALLGQAEPFAAALLGWVIFGDLPTFVQWVGGLFIILGSVVIAANFNKVRT